MSRERGKCCILLSVYGWNWLSLQFATEGLQCKVNKFVIPQTRFGVGQAASSLDLHNPKAERLNFSMPVSFWSAIAGFGFVRRVKGDHS